ncbi:unnamed protein product [Blepharisma stoltei]|uniref:Methyltransferase small domain-containing protein n=1 Tax=Blepharisma stoltei TaxID=1481888 RepID=A0AAU9JJA6_9CILI|nr:unnamed protein product [Blepharisma stoltei]
MNIKEVKLSHIKKDDRKKVYPPSQDTFILIDAILNDIEYIKALNPTIVLEIGVGSGAVISSLALNLDNAFFLGFDINIDAVKLTQRTFCENRIEMADVVGIDILKGLNLRNKVDVVICNPPYVTSTREEYLECQNNRDISSSCPGGENGREFIDELLRVVDGILSENGVLYLLYEEENGQFGGINLLTERTGCEGLCVIRRNKNNQTK